MSTLPIGWTETSIDSVCVPTEQKIPETDLEFTYIDISSVDRVTKRISQPQRVLGKEAPSRARKLVKAGDTIVSMTRPNLNAVALVGEEYSGQIASTGFEILRSTGLESRWIGYLVRTNAFVDAMSSLVQGALYPAIRGKDVRAFEIPLAPLSEQRRIADKLDTVLTRVDALNDRLARITPLLKRFRQSVLAAATSGRLTEKAKISADSFFPVVLTETQQKNIPSKWNWKCLTDLARLESGHTPRKSVPEYWDGGDVPWISLQDIRSADGLVIYETKLQPTNLGIENSSARLLPAGTVCFCRDISFGYVTIMGREMATSQHFVNWVCGEKLNPKYLMYALMASRDFLAMSGQGTTVTTIYMPALKGLRIAVPSTEEQTEIVRRVEILFAYADRLEARLQAARTAAERLTPALLAKAFRGELVPQDPNDEPATELLRRLREARASEAPIKKPRARKAAV